MVYEEAKEKKMQMRRAKVREASSLVTLPTNRGYTHMVANIAKSKNKD